LKNSKKTIKEYFAPGSKSLPADGSGFKANSYIWFLRSIALFIVTALRLNGKTRWSNEFIQTLDPKLTSIMSSGINFPSVALTFRTGHGRLYWRATETVNLEPETNQWIRAFTESDVFYDIGANVGVYAMFAAKCTTAKQKIVAIEPEPKNYAVLFDNLILNSIPNVVALPVALSDKNNLKVFNISSPGPGSARNFLLDEKEGGEHISRSFVKLNLLSMRLDWLVESFNLPHPTVVKLDVDGNELMILEGFGKYIKTVRSIVVEIKDGSEQIFVDFFASNNFKVSKIGEYASQSLDTRNYIFDRNEHTT
jgi:FkbM family methyltransferase